MMLRGQDLIRIAELIKLGAETAMSFSEVSQNGKASEILDAVKRIEAAADELIKVGRQLEDIRA